MELDGSLKEFGAPAVLRFLDQGKLSGVLVLEREGERLRVAVREGKVTRCEARNGLRRLALGCVRNGLLQHADLRAIPSDEEDGRAAQALVEAVAAKGPEAVKTFAETIEAQLRENVWDALFWTEGTFQFENRDAATAPAAIAELDIGPVLEAYERERPALAEALDSLSDTNAVLEPRTLEHGDRATIGLSADEWQILALVDGASTAACATERSHLGRVSTLRILGGLLQKGLIRQVSTLPTASDTPGVGAEAPEAAIPSSPPQGEECAPGDAEKQIDEKDSAAQEEDSPRVSASCESARPRFGFFRWFRRAKTRAEPEEKAEPSAPAATPQPPVQFQSPVRMLVDAVNRWLDRLDAADRGSHPDGNGHSQTLRGETLAARWRRIAGSHPRADLVTVQNGRLCSDRFDGYVRKAGDEEGPLRECHDETVEGLCRLLAWLREESAQTLGEEGSRRLAAEIARFYGAAPPTRAFWSFRIGAVLRRFGLAPEH